MAFLLTIDVGNTNTVLGYFAGESLVATARVTTIRERTSDEHVLLLRELHAAKGLALPEVKNVIISSVVPSQEYPLKQAIKELFHFEAQVIAPGFRTGMRILYDMPQEVGADRIVNAVGAFERHGGPCIVVDFGTATTFDVVSPQGDYLGGVICPGAKISADALFTRAARLFRVDIGKPQKVVGKTTAWSIQSGLYWGTVAMSEGLIARLREENGWPDAKVVTTGGLATLFADASPDLATVDPDLTLHGLRILHDRNRKR